MLVAFGSCAHEGCIPGLANLSTREQIFDTAYRDTPSTDNPEGVLPQVEFRAPEGLLQLPAFYDTLKTLDQTVPVDYYLPGCPPEAERIWDALVAILEGKLPAPGSVIGRDSTVCDECSRTRQEKQHHGLQAQLRGPARRRDLPARAGAGLLRHRHPQRLRRALPAGQLALHRLLRAARAASSTSARA